MIYKRTRLCVCSEKKRTIRRIEKSWFIQRSEEARSSFTSYSQSKRRLGPKGKPEPRRRIKTNVTESDAASSTQSILVINSARSQVPNGLAEPEWTKHGSDFGVGFSIVSPFDLASAQANEVARVCTWNCDTDICRSCQS